MQEIMLSDRLWQTVSYTKAIATARKLDQQQSSPPQQLPNRHNQQFLADVITPLPKNTNPHQTQPNNPSITSISIFPEENIEDVLPLAHMWMCQSVVTKCEYVIDQMDNPVRAIAIATTYSLKDELVESFRGKVMDMNGDRLISHDDFSHLPYAIQNAIYRDLAERGVILRGGGTYYSTSKSASIETGIHISDRHTDSIHIRVSKIRTCHACRDINMLEEGSKGTYN